MRPEEIEIVNDLIVEIRELIFDDASGTMQGGLIGSPVDVLLFAKHWIMKAKGLAHDCAMFETDN